MTIIPDESKPKSGSASESGARPGPQPTAEADPPSYDFATTTQGSSSGSAYGGGSAAGTSTAPPLLDPAARSFGSPPPNAQRALAPLEARSTNRAVKGCFVVILPDSDSAPSGPSGGVPDAVLKSSNGSVKAGIWFEGAEKLGRPVRVEIGSTNGAVKAVIPNLQMGAGILHVTASSTNGRVQVYVPPTFRGTISLRSTNGRTELSPAIHRAGTVVLPSEGKHTMTWRIGEGGNCKLEGRSSNGNVLIGFANEPGAMDGIEAGDDNADGGNCCVM